MCPAAGYRERGTYVFAGHTLADDSGVFVDEDGGFLAAGVGALGKGEERFSLAEGLCEHIYYF